MLWILPIVLKIHGLGWRAPHDNASEKKERGNEAQMVLRQIWRLRLFFTFEVVHPVQGHSFTDVCISQSDVLVCGHVDKYPQGNFWAASVRLKEFSSFLAANVPDAFNYH